MRILCVAAYYKPAYVYGGPARSIPALCEGMVRAGNEVTVFTTNANGEGKMLDVPTAHPVEVDGVRVHYFPVFWPFARSFPFYSKLLGEACRRLVNQFDVVYLPATWTYAMWAGASAAVRLNVPYVVSPRGSFMDWSMRQKRLKKHLYLELFERRLIDGAAAMHCTSHLESEQIKQWNFRPPVVVIPNGIDTSAYIQLPEKGGFRQALNLPNTATVSLFVGRLHTEKRLDLMIEAFSRVVGSVKDAHLVIIGPEADGTGGAVRRQVAELGLSEHVRLMGLLTGQDLLQAYRDSDMLLLLSHRENFGMVAVEAMALELPVLLAEEVGLAQEIAEANAGYCVKAQPDSVADRWTQMLSTPGARQEMGQRGKKLVQQRFDSAVVAKQMLRMFRPLSHNL